MTSPGASRSRASDEAVINPQAELGRLKVELAAVRGELRACREAQERNHSALCAIADGIAIVDTAGCVTCLNPVASHLSGWREEACLGLPLGTAVQFTDHHGRSIDVLAEGFSSDPDASVSLIRRDGHSILVDGAVSPVHGRDKRPLGAVVTFRNVTASTRMARELAYHANHDVLTGLQNRRAFRAQLQRAIGNAGKFGNANALLYLDLDEFKAVNDGGGHRAGDELLRRLAVLLRKQLREHDTVARLGGDEFAVLLENCTATDAAHAAGKIRDAVAALAFSWGGRDYRIGTSIGLVAFDDGNRSVEQLMAIADRMCYAAKDAGRNSVAIHDPGGDRTLPPGRHASIAHDARSQDGAAD